MKFVMPKVFILAETKMDPDYNDFLECLGVQSWDTNAPSDSEKLIEIAGKTCYLSFNTSLNSNLNKVRTNQNEEYIQKGLIGQNHTSVLEHASVTFGITNVSRVFTHELVRHSAGCAYSQESSRYVRTEEIKAFFPSLPEHVHGVFKEILNNVEISYKTLESLLFKNIGNNDFDTKKKITSAIRRVLPEGRVNTIVFTANHRAIRHIIEMRTSEHAEEEIALVFNQIKKLMLERYPNIYKDMGQ